MFENLLLSSHTFVEHDIALVRHPSAVTIAIPDGFVANQPSWNVIVDGGSIHEVRFLLDRLEVG